MILTAEQAAALPDPFVIDGYDMTVQDCEGYALNGPMNRAPGPPPPWADLDQPCPNCDGDGCAPPPGSPAARVGDCHGTGRLVTELVLDCGDYFGGRESLGLFTVQVLPIVADDSREYLTYPHICAGLIWRVAPSPHGGGYLTESITLPPDAQPGEYAVITTKVDTK